MTYSLTLAQWCNRQKIGSIPNFGVNTMRGSKHANAGVGVKLISRPRSTATSTTQCQINQFTDMRSKNEPQVYLMFKKLVASKS